MFLTTERESYTGQIIYSDVYRRYHGVQADPNAEDIEQKPFLNKWAAIPIIGCFAGLTRIVISIIHIIGHLIMAAITQDKGHLYHAAKGGTEALRGLIEATPIVGRIFVWVHDPNDMKDLFEMICFDKGYTQTGRTDWNFFLIKIVNPNHPDHIDYAANKA